jgi:regulator of sigma E protease
MSAQSLLEFIFTLAALIIIHEFGHFIVCRLCKVEVEEFGLGFPPRMLNLFTAGGTRFTLNWLPFGGFVRPKGENDPSIPRGLAAANPWKRIAVYLAGPGMNILVGIILYMVIFSKFGNPVPVENQVQIMAVAADSPAQQAGLQACDYFVKVNNQDITSTDQLQLLIKSNLGKSTSMVLQRGSQVYEANLIPRLNPPVGQGAIGISMSNPIQFQPIGLTAALPMGMTAVYNYGHELVTLPGRMIRGQIPPDQGRLVGFKGMYDMYQEVSQSNTGNCTPRLMNILAFFAAITTSLGLLNLLPVPALDGGRIIFVLPEIIIRRRIPQEYENWINVVSFSLLLLVILYINLQDFINPIVFPK